jgi:hypothetical protein
MSGGGWSKIAWNQVAFKDFRSRWDLIRDFLMSPQSEGQ